MRKQEYYKGKTISYLINKVNDQVEFWEERNIRVKLISLLQDGEWFTAVTEREPK